MANYDSSKFSTILNALYFQSLQQLIKVMTRINTNAYEADVLLLLNVNCTLIYGNISCYLFHYIKIYFRTPNSPIQLF